MSELNRAPFCSVEEDTFGPLIPGRCFVRGATTYTLVRLRGQGSFGDVWEVKTSTALGLRWALKIIGGSQAIRLETEALANIRNLRHPNVLRVHDSWVDEGRLFILQDLAEGSLTDRLSAGVAVEQLLDDIAGAAAGLDYLHARKVIHRDVKPANLLYRAGVVLVADFGLLVALPENATSCCDSRAVGTPVYMAPEQLFSYRVHPSGDLFSLAVTYMHLRLGDYPQADGSTRKWRPLLSEQPDLSRLPRAERRVILKALERDPAERQRSFATCTAFVEELQRAVASASEPTRAGALFRWLWRGAEDKAAVPDFRSSYESDLENGFYSEETTHLDGPRETAAPRERKPRPLQNAVGAALALVGLGLLATWVAYVVSLPTDVAPKTTEPAPPHAQEPTLPPAEDFVEKTAPAPEPSLPSQEEFAWKGSDEMSATKAPTQPRNQAPDAQQSDFLRASGKNGDCPPRPRGQSPFFPDALRQAERFDGLAWDHLWANRPAEAARDFAEAKRWLNLLPDQGHAYEEAWLERTTANGLQLSGRESDVKAAFASAVRARLRSWPEEMTALAAFYEGWSYRLESRPEEAVRAYRKALEGDPRKETEVHLRVRLQCGWFLVSKKYHERLLPDLAARQALKQLAERAHDLAERLNVAEELLGETYALVGYAYECCLKGLPIDEMIELREHSRELLRRSLAKKGNEKYRPHWQAYLDELSSR